MRPDCTFRRLAPILLLCCAAAAGCAERGKGPGQSGRVLHVAVEDAITPVTARHLEDAIGAARRRGDRAVVVQLDTPGGLDTSMRTATKAILNSEIPVIVWVGPSGARAASAGMFLALAAHVAAMAPGTNIGAAHPVGIGGMGAPDTTMAGKIVNDAVAYVRSIAGQRGRNADWAERAVRESVSLEAEEAMREGVCDLIAESLRDLLERTDGRVVETVAGAETLATAGVPLFEFQMTWQERILAVITNPNIAYLLFLAGILGIFFELSNPGAILPGIIGGISLILALFAFQSLSVNFAGVLLMILALIMFLAEIKVPSNGALTIGGVVSLLLGSLMLFRTASGGPAVSLGIVVPALLVTVAFFLVAIGLAIRAQRRRTTTGSEGMVGEIGRVVEAIDPEGKIFLRGEIWSAVSDVKVERGARAQVVAVEGLTLHVVPMEGGGTARKE